ETQPAKRLEKARAVLARVGVLGGDCLRGERKRGEALAVAAARALAAPPDDALRRRLPADAALNATVAEVRAERSKRIDEAGVAERASEVPSRAAPSAAPSSEVRLDGAAPAAPQIRPTAKPATAAPAAKRPA